MKKLVTIAATAAMVALAGGKAAAQNETRNETHGVPRAAVQTSAQAPAGVAKPDQLKVRVTGIGQDSGTVLVALMDYMDPSRMVAAKIPTGDAKEGAVECTLKGEIDLDATLYVFLDANGNYDLDRGEKGTPH